MVIPIVPNLASVYVTEATPVSMTNEAMSVVGAGNTVYEVSNVEHRYLDDTTETLFQADVAGNGEFVTVSGKVEHAGGRIILDTPRSESDVVRLASGKYFPRKRLLGASVAKLNADIALIETPLLGDGFVRRIPGTKDFSFTCDAYMVDSNETGEKLHDVSALMSRKLIIQMYVNTTSDTRLEGFAYLESDSINLESKGVVMNNLSFKGSGELYYREG